MSTSFIPGIILIVTILSALGSGVFGGLQSLGLVLWIVSANIIIAMLANAYVIGAKLDKLVSGDHKHTVRAHVLLHLVPLTYFPIAYAVVKGSLLEAIYFVPVIIFFITGVQTWKLCFQLFRRIVYRLFQIGNLQMLFFFPLALISDFLGWPAEGADTFRNLMRVYFVVHFILAGITIPLMGRDLRRYTSDSLVKNNPNASR